MKKLKVFIHESAIQDLEEIWSFEQANRYHGLIYKEIEFLAGEPESGKDLNHIRKGYRSSKVKSHLIFYKDSPAGIEIIRILHENMDIPNRLVD